MATKEKLLEKARNSPSSLRFQEICKLAESFGWIFKRCQGSHNIYMNPKLTLEQGRRQNFQSEGGKAKDYQIKQLLDAIEYLE